MYVSKTNHYKPILACVVLFVCLFTYSKGDRRAVAEFYFMYVSINYPLQTYSCLCCAVSLSVCL